MSAETTHPPELAGQQPMTPFQLLLHYFRNVEESGRRPDMMYLLVHDKDSIKPDGWVSAFDSDFGTINKLAQYMPVGSRVRVLGVSPDMVRTIRPPKEEPAEEGTNLMASEPEPAPAVDNPVEIVPTKEPSVGPRMRMRSRS